MVSVFLNSKLVATDVIMSYRVLERETATVVDTRLLGTGLCFLLARADAARSFCWDWALLKADLTAAGTSGGGGMEECTGRGKFMCKA